MAKLETVRIIFGDGFLRINQVDFDPKQHQIYSGEVPESFAPINTMGIDLNTATASEIKAALGLTVANSKKVFDGRPYQSISDLEKLELGIDLEAINDKVFVSRLPVAEA